MKSEILKRNNGFSGTDILASIAIIILFVSIITASFYNYYTSIQSKNRQTVATNIMIDVIENVEAMKYEDITQESINSLIKELKQKGNIQDNYEVSANIEKYNERSGNEQKMDLIKILKVNVRYMSNNKEENLEIKRLITK